MEKTIERRILDSADYMIEHEATVRQVAKKFGYSKTAVHLDLTVRLSRISTEKAEQVAKIMQKNKEEMAVRGGRALKKKP